MSNNQYIDPGLAEAWAESEAARKARHPNAALKEMLESGASLGDMLSGMNKIYAVVKYGGEIVIANIVGRKIDFMSDREFHKMMANQVFESRRKNNQTQSPLVQLGLSSAIHRARGRLRAGWTSRDFRATC